MGTHGYFPFLDEGCAYVVKDENMIGLGLATTIGVMKEGNMRGFGAEEKRKKAEKIERESDANERKKNSFGYKVL